MDSLDFSWIGCTMGYNIDAWNMVWGGLADREIWFTHDYGRVVSGSPEPGPIFL